MPRYRLAPNDGSLKITSKLYFLSTHFNIFYCHYSTAYVFCQHPEKIFFAACIKLKLVQYYLYKTSKEVQNED